jgi:serine/threonine-protein kinase
MLQADAATHHLLDCGLLMTARLEPGDTIGTHLQILALIGSGGMGEVYRAHDSSLGRDVAIKVLRWTAAVDVAAERERLQRLKREAHVLAALNHPNIAVIYAIEELPAFDERGTDAVALVLELVEGPTLADRLDAGRPSISDVVRTAKQIAEALEAAHARGIVHRDLKPSNVKLRPDGVVKLLDFGLAKVAATGAGPPASITTTDPSSAQRTLRLGTPAYMSPEQARSQEPDTRSDIWSYGAVLYEMLSGVRAFPGDDAASATAAVLQRPVDWTKLDHSTPPAIRTLLARCLDRDPRRRLRDIGEARIALEDLEASALRTSNEIDRPAPGRRRIWTAAAIMGATVAAALAFIVSWPKASDHAAVSRFTLATSLGSALDVDPQSRDLTLTPDGRHIVYKGGNRNDRTQLFVRSLDQIEPVALTPPGRPKGPFSSPDGRWIGFFEPGGGGPILKKVALSGGPIVEVARMDGASRGAAWAEDDTIVVATAALSTGLQRFPAGGGPAEILTRPARDKGEADHLWPHLLPGGRSVLFTITSINGGLAASQVAVLDLRSRTWKTIVRGGRQAEYLPTGHLVYVAGESLWSIAFDLAALETRGPARMVVPQVLTLPTGAAEYDVAPDGTLVYASGRVLTARRTLSWVERDGREQDLDGAAQRPYASLQLSPDGTRVALQIDDDSNDIWVWDLTRKTLTRVTDDPGLDQGPVWSRNGHLIFTSQASGAIGSLFRKSADGSGVAERLTASPSVQRASGLLPDGSGVLFDESYSDIMLLRFADRTPRPLVRTPLIEQSAVVAPGGRWLAYVERDAGPPQIFVRPFPDVDASKLQISTSGGTQPVWARDGRELFYLSVDGQLMSVAVTRNVAMPFALPRQVLQRRYFTGVGLTSHRTYDVAPDGRRFLMVKAPPSAGDPPTAVQMVVVLNWFDDLRRVPSASAR